MSTRVVPPRRHRLLSPAAVLTVAALCLTLIGVPRAPAAEIAPAPRLVDPVGLDRALMAEIKDRSELMKNLEYLSDSIGPRLTGSKQLERANRWAEKKMKEYGLENVRLEPWEIPVGWERGGVSMRIVEPDTGVRLSGASIGWTPGTNGKVTGEVVVVRARTKSDLDRYKGKLKNAITIISPPQSVAPVTDLSYGPLPPPPPKKVAPKKAEPKKEKAEVAPDDACELSPEDDPKQPEPKKTQPKPEELPPVGRSFLVSARELDEFFKAEGVACRIGDAGKPHGLLMAVGQWRSGDRAAQDPTPRVLLAHEHFAMLWRLANRPAPAVTRVEVEIRNTFIPGPITVFNTVGEVRGREKPDEYVVVGAHLDSWDLASGTTDNGTGTCVVLETARAVAELARRGQRPRRTIRFCLFTGEEQGLWGSRRYVAKHKDEMSRTSVALVHDTGTGKVFGFGVHGLDAAAKVLEPELATLATMEGWRGLDLGGVYGSDHQSFHSAGVPGFACRQDIDEYRLTHHTQTDTFDHAKAANLIQGAQALAVTAVRVANLPELLPRTRNVPRKNAAK